MDVNEVKIYLKQNNFVPSKKMGQNFLTDDNIAQNIIKFIKHMDFDHVMEIGPGLGAITEKLIEINNSLTAVEIDKRLFSFLKKKYKNLNVINNDVLEMDWDQYFSPYDKPIVVSNLPYSISSPIIAKFFKCNKINTMVCMLQKEMVERLLAKIRTHQYNAFSVFIQSLAGIKQIMVVSKTCFYPIPEVDSVVIQIVKKITSIKIDDYDVFLKRCFLSKRKTLVNNLLHSKIDKERLLQFLAKHNLSPLTRAEELNVEHFQELFNIWNQRD